MVLLRIVSAGCADGIEVIVNNNNNRMQELTIIYNVYFFT